MNGSSNRTLDLVLTGIAPTIWGSTYIVTTEMLAGWHPLTVALLRALPAGLLLLLIVRTVPRGIWLARTAILGALNFSIFWTLLFVSAYRLPGGVAATIGAIQPLIVVLMARVALGTPVTAIAVASAIGGLVGVGLLVLSPQAALDAWGVAAGLGGAASMALGTVLTRRWQPPVPALTFTAWQLAAGGVLLLPLVAWLHPLNPAASAMNVLGFVWLSLVGGAATYLVWFRGIARLGPTSAAPLALMSPVAAVLLGWLGLGQTLDVVQIMGMTLVLASIVFSQLAARDRQAPTPP